MRRFLLLRLRALSRLLVQSFQDAPLASLALITLCAWLGAGLYERLQHTASGVIALAFAGPMTWHYLRRDFRIIDVLHLPRRRVVTVDYLLLDLPLLGIALWHGYWLAVASAILAPVAIAQLPPRGTPRARVRRPNLRWLPGPEWATNFAGAIPSFLLILGLAVLLRSVAVIGVIGMLVVAAMATSFFSGQPEHWLYAECSGLSSREYLARRLVRSAVGTLVLQLPFGALAVASAPESLPVVIGVALISTHAHLASILLRFTQAGGSMRVGFPASLTFVVSLILPPAGTWLLVANWRNAHTALSRVTSR